MTEPFPFDAQATEQLRVACAHFGTHVDLFGRFVTRLEALAERSDPDPEVPE